MITVDKYLKEVPATQKAELERVRAVIKAVVPDAEEVITYGMPGFKYKKKCLISYAPFKNHMSIFPGGECVDLFASELTDFKTSKGTIQFTAEKPLPNELLKKIIEQRVEAIQ